MKWYSIKEFTAPLYQECLIATENGYSYVARLEVQDEPDLWMHNYHCEKCGNCFYEEIVDVTHFCIIEPVPISKA